MAEVQILDPTRPAGDQIPPGTDLAHFFFPPAGEVPVPYLVWIQGNPSAGSPIDQNTVFVSRRHAERYGSKSFVYNGIDPSDYGQVDWAQPRSHLHFLAKAAWKVKNLPVAMKVARLAVQARRYAARSSFCGVTTCAGAMSGFCTTGRPSFIAGASPRSRPSPSAPRR